MQEQTLGRRIQEARKAAGLSQESLGERLGVSRQAVSKWEADAAVPELENLIAMSRIFGVTIGALLGMEPAAEEPTEEDSPEAPGGESGDAAPDRELTDRELAAVEAIVQKYLEAVRRPRWSRRKKLAAVAGACAAVLLIVLILNGIFSSLGRRLDQVQDQVNYVQSSVSSQIGSLTGQLSGLLEEQTSLISDYQLQVTDYDLEEAVWYLTASVTPQGIHGGHRDHLHRPGQHRRDRLSGGPKQRRCLYGGKLGCAHGRGRGRNRGRCGRCGGPHLRGLF